MATDKVLVVGPSWVGDMVMAQALYKLLRLRNAGLEIHVVAPPWSLEPATNGRTMRAFRRLGPS